MGHGGKVAVESVTDTIGSAATTIGSAATKARGPMLAGGAAAAGVIGGLVLGGRVLRPGTKVLGVRVARRDATLRPVAKQLGRMADEIVKAREQAQRIGKALA